MYKLCHRSSPSITTITETLFIASCNGLTMMDLINDNQVFLLPEDTASCDRRNDFFNFVFYCYKSCTSLK